MALDREDTFREAERCVRTGRLPEALALCRRLAEESPRDLLMLNRIGDLLARAGRIADAAGYYDRIAERFVEAGFLPRAAAILKKILKLDPSRTDALVRLGELYIRQRLVGEGRAYLLRAADRFVAAHDLKSARRVYERLVAAEPAEPLHRVRLAETKAAEGDPKGASEDLRAAVAAFERAGRRQEAEASSRRLVELLEEAGRRLPADADVASALLVEYERAGREREAEALLEQRGGTSFQESAIERWAEARVARCGQAAALEALEPVLRRWVASGRADRAAGLLERLSRAGASAASLERLRSALPEAPQPVEAGEPLAREPRALAVPSDRDEEELLSGYLTEAEVFERYGLLQEAVRQLREATQRFPGHVGAQQRLADLLREQGDRAGWADALCDVALARKAAGDVPGAREAAAEAMRGAVLSSARLDALRREGLLEPESAVPERRAATEPHGTPAPGLQEAQPVSGAGQAEETEVEIVFEEAETVSAPLRAEATVAARGQGRGERALDPQLVEEISFYLDQGMVAEAAEKVRALRTLGYKGAVLDALEARASEAAAERCSGRPSSALFDEEELEALTGILEAELAESASAPVAEEQSLEEVFEAFKRHVAKEVGAADHQTHYDLGIGYREMGLLDDALEEFRRASEAPELRRQACSMLALCHRERGELAEAARWYREALAAARGPEDGPEGLRYELAETLLASGDARAALDLFLEVAETDPTYRDVGSRVVELRARLGS